MVDLAAKLAPLIGRGGFAYSIKTLRRIDPGYSARLMGHVEEAWSPPHSSVGISLPQVAADLEAAAAASPTVAASLAREIDDVILVGLLDAEPIPGRVATSVSRLSHVNRAKASSFLRRAGAPHLADLGVRHGDPAATGRFLRALADADPTLAQDVLTSISMDTLIDLASGTGGGLSGHAILARGVGSIDPDRARLLHAQAWDRLQGIFGDSFSPSDVAEGIRRLAEVEAEDAIRLLRERPSIVRDLLVDARPAADVVELLTAIRDATKSEPDLARELTLGIEASLAGRVTADEDVQSIGQLLSALADVSPTAALEALGDEDTWTLILQKARNVSAMGKVNALIKGIALAEEAAGVALVLSEAQRPQLELLVSSLAARVAEEPRIGLTTRIFNAVAYIRNALPDIADRFVAEIGDAAVFADRARTAKECDGLAKFIESAERVAPPPHRFVGQIVSGIGEAPLAEMISAEGQVWRTVCLNRSLLACERSGNLKSGTLRAIWECSQLDYRAVADRLMWGDRLSAGAVLLRELQEDISGEAAHKVATRVCDGSSRTRFRMASASPVSAGALLLALQAAAGRHFEHVWSETQGHVQAIADRAKSARELAWFALVVSRFDQITARALVNEGLNRYQFTPAEGVLLAAAAGRAEAVPALSRPTAETVEGFVRDSQVHPLDRALALRFWGAVSLLSGSSLAWTLVDEVAASPQASWSERDEVGISDPSRLSQPLSPAEVRRCSWAIYDTFLSQPIRWYASTASETNVVN